MQTPYHLAKARNARRDRLGEQGTRERTKTLCERRYSCSSTAATSSESSRLW